jgi:CO/xanthine dehydrogenase Mo-binding subunit
MGEYSVIGKRVPQFDAIEKVTGQTKYTMDLSLPGMLWGKVLRSPIHHGKIKRIDVRRAAEIAGVRAIITGKDVPKSRYGFDFAADRPGDKYILPRTEFVTEGTRWRQQWMRRRGESDPADRSGIRGTACGLRS